MLTLAELEKNDDIEVMLRAHKQFGNHVTRRILEGLKKGEDLRDSIKTPEELSAYQKKLREDTLEGLGGLCEDAPLDPKITGVIEYENFSIQKIIFCPRPKTYVTANLYLPKNITGKRAAVLFLCGHGKEAKAYRVYQTVCRRLVRSGLIVLSMDCIGQGERISYLEDGKEWVRWGSGEHDYTGHQCFLAGGPIARYFLHDSMRALDYLLTRPEVDPARIGVTGNSGGGTQTCLMMLCDPRIAAAAPGTFITSRQDYNAFIEQGGQDAEQIWPGLGLRGFDHEDTIIAMAPKPVLALAVTQDYFPIEGTRRTVERSSRIYELCGKKENLGIAEDDNTHGYTPFLREAAARFFEKHLLDKDCSITEVSLDPIDPMLLNCAKTGQVVTEFPDSRFVWHENSNLVKKNRIARKAEGIEKARAWLSKRIFGNRPSCGTDIRFITPYCSGPDGYYQYDDIKVESAFYLTQPDLVNHIMLFRSAGARGEIPVTIALWRDGHHKLQDHGEWIRSICAAGRAVAVVCLTGEGCLSPDRDILNLTHELYWFNDSLPGIRVFDITRAIDALSKWPGIKPEGFEIYARDYHTIYARLAAFLDKRILRVDCDGSYPRLDDAASSKYYLYDNIADVLIPDMLKHFDLDELCCLTEGLQISVSGYTLK